MGLEYPIMALRGGFEPPPTETSRLGALPLSYPNVWDRLSSTPKGLCASLDPLLDLIARSYQVKNILVVRLHPNKTQDEEEHIQEVEV